LTLLYLPWGHYATGVDILSSEVFLNLCSEGKKCMPEEFIGHTFLETQPKLNTKIKIAACVVGWGEGAQFAVVAVVGE